VLAKVRFKLFFLPSAIKKCKTEICSAAILPDVLSRFGNWSLTLTEKSGKWSSETRILKKAFEPNERK
jgi:hypothetical protein